MTTIKQTPIVVRRVDESGHETEIGVIDRVIKVPFGIPHVRIGRRWERIWWEDGQPFIVLTKGQCNPVLR